MSNAQSVSGTRLIPATAPDIFALLCDVSLHQVIDGSGSVRSPRRPYEPLRLGSTFSMSMKIFVPYVISNKVVEFEQDKLIAWQHLGKHRWRYELEEQTSIETLVTETFDWSYAVSPKAIELMQYPPAHAKNIEKTLARMDSFFSHKLQVK